MKLEFSIYKIVSFFALLTRSTKLTEKEFLGIDDRIFAEVIYSPVCTLCKHFHIQKKIKYEGLKPIRKHECDAFSEGIPEEIWRGDNDHTRPYPRDNGIRFEHV
jgi:hypothetical protein